MLTGFIYAAALLLELAALFAIWDRRRRSRPVVWLMGGCTTLSILAGLLMLVPDPSSSRIYFGFLGMYLAAGLAWAWWMEDLRLADWEPGEVALAVLATAMLACGSSGW